MKTRNVLSLEMEDGSGRKITFTVGDGKTPNGRGSVRVTDGVLEAWFELGYDHLSALSAFFYKASVFQGIGVE